MISFALCSFAQELPTFVIKVDRFIVEGENPLSPAATEQVLSEYRGSYDSLDGLLAAKDALEKAFAAEGYSFHRVILPRQRLSDGVVRLQTLVYKIGEITVSGNKHFNEKNILGSVSKIKPGVTPNTREIARIINHANRHPSKQLDINLRESEIPDSVDAVVSVKDRRPYTVFSALNNIGSDETGDTRITVGAQYNNLWNLDHRITGTYTTSPENTRNVKQYGVTYSLPLYWIFGEITSFYLKSDVDTGTVGDFEISGAGEFIGASFRQVLPRMGKYRHEWSVGIQDRLFENDVFFLAIPLGADVRSRPFNLGYAGAYTRESFSTDFDVSYTSNLSSGHRNSNPSYAAARSGADSNWNAWRFSGSLNYFLPKKWLARGTLRGQLADEPLIAGEQMGIGGVHSVRGFEQRVAAGDNVIQGSVEVWSPPITLLGAARALAFYDYGYKDLENALPGQADHADFLSSAGVGMRWQWTEHLTVSVDYGHTLDRALQFDGRETGNVKWNFSIYLRL